MRSLLWRVVVGVLFAAAMLTLPVHAGPPQSANGQVTVGGLVAGPPPATPPTITTPASGTTFNQKLIDVKGSCISGLTVRVFRNAIFAGSTACQTDNTYALQIDLTEGRNDLIARQYDTANQSSPDSDDITVFYAPPGGPSLPGEGQPSSSSPSGQPAPVAQFQLIIDYDYSFTGVTVGTPLHLPIHFMGGTPPYAISVTWGDREQSVVSRENTDQFFVDHTFKTPGTYIVKISISDKNGNQAYLQFVLIVNGKGAETPVSLFGTPVTLDLLPSIAIPSLATGVVGLLGGFYFGHRWRLRRSGTDKGDKPNDTSTTP